MNKKERKLAKLTQKAEECTTREEAQKILKKTTKTRAKLYVDRMIEDD